jgi:hypothetical protein
MACPWVPVEGGEIPHDLCPERVEMDVAAQLTQVRLLFHQDRLVAILEQVPVPLVAVVERHRVPGEQPAHGRG